MAKKEKKVEIITVGQRKVILPEWEEDKGSKRRFSAFFIVALIIHIAVGSFFGSSYVRKVMEEARLREIKILEEKSDFLNRKPVAMIQPIQQEQRKEIKQELLKELMKQKTIQPEQMNAKIDEKSIQENLESQAKFDETQDEAADVIVGITKQKDISDILSSEALPAITGGGGGGGIDYVEFFKVEVKPEPIRTVMPEYPEVARKAGLEGRVTVAVIVDENGNVIHAEVVNSTNKVFEEPALKAAYQYKFKPGMMKDRKVKVRVIIPFAFKLQS
ncbi:MAG: energy transducer TonB [candidate division WOR-3 bacterium]|jgi:protein TonB